MNEELSGGVMVYAKVSFPATRTSTDLGGFGGSTARIFPMHNNKRTVAEHNQLVVEYVAVAGRALKLFLLTLEDA